MRRPTPRSAAFLLVSILLAAGCGTPPEAVRPAPILSQADAAAIFDHYVAERAAADEALDDTRLGTVESGALLAESRADNAVRRAVHTTETTPRHVRPRFFIPADGRFFVVLSKKSDAQDGKTSVVHYFRQVDEGGPWTAAGEFFAVTEAEEGVGTTGPAQQGSTNPVVHPEKLEPITTDTAGAAVQSPTADADRAVCGRYAGYLSLTLPAGQADSPHFTPGSFTGDFVTHLDTLAADNSSRTLRYHPSGVFPVLRLDTGAALVACTLRTTDTLTATTPNGVSFAAGSPQDVLLGGGNRAWRRTFVETSVTALIEVPPGGTGPASVLSCTCYQPVVLSATGIPLP